jgi:hypothetical protein
MREAVYDDAIYIARVLKDDEKKIWARIKGVRFTSIADLIVLLKEMQKGRSDPDS